MTTAAQLPLPLGEPHGLPSLPVDADWKAQPRGWGHPFHPICTWMGSLPPAMAHALIERFSRPGDVVLDPFSGRGTVPLQACLRRRIGVGVDRNPLAALLTGAVLEPPARRDAETRLAHLRIDWTHQAARRREEAAAMQQGSVAAAGLFHPKTLAELLFLRDALDRSDRTDRFLLAALAGILHGARDSFLTDAMPNAFSMAPGYSRTWLAARGDARPRRDAFVLLERRIGRLYRSGIPISRGIAIEGDARDAATAVRAALRARALPDRARLVVTSPPYLRVIRYGLANWLRLWMIGEDAARVDDLLTAPASARASETLLAEVLDDLRPILAADAVVALVLGSVESDRGRRLPGPIELAEGAARAAAGAGYLVAGVSTDAVDPARKLTRIWGEEAGRATRADRILLVAPTAAGVARARAAASLPVDWSPAMPAMTPVGRPAASAVRRPAAAGRTSAAEPAPTTVEAVATR